MKYSICYLLRGDVAKFHKQKVRELAKKFNELYLLENPIPSHTTLKYPFITQRIKEIEDMLKEFVKKQKKGKIEVRKVTNFNKKAVCLQLSFSKKANKTFKGLVKKLHKFDWLEWGVYDKTIDGKFHSTLIYGNTPANFKRIWKEVSDLKIKFDLEFNNITILKKQRKYWKIHKVYEIQ
ncbi:MAG: 2'-5' RNA ligase family protein [archaeon]